MTTRAYIHAPVPSFPRIAGPLAVRRVDRRTGLSINSHATITVAADDVNLDWMRAGMCWALDQSDIGEPLWAGFVSEEIYPMNAEEVEVPLDGPKQGLLEVEMAVRLPLTVRAGYAVRRALESAQARNGGIFPGTIEQGGPAVSLDVRGETINDFIETIKESTTADWRERVVARGNELLFYMDFGALKNQTDIVLGKNEIVVGQFRRGRLISSLTEVGQGAGFDQRATATVAGGARTSAAEPAQGILTPEDERVSELLRQRDIGPAASRHVVEISERVGAGALETLAQERHVELLRGIEQIAFTLDGTKTQAQQVQVGDVVNINLPRWFKTLDVNVDVHIREINPQDTAGQRDVIASVEL